MDEVEEESYWTASNVKSSIEKKDIFSDSVTIDNAATLAKFKRDLDNEVIDWDDTPVTINPEPDSGQRRPLSDQNTGRPSTTQMTLSRSEAQVPKPQMESSSSLSSNVSLGGINLSFDALTNDSRSLALCSDSEKDQQIRYLQARLKKAEETIGVSKLKVSDTVKKMLGGQAFSLELYRSKEEKLELLDQVLMTHDGNAIICVVIFLKKSLSDQIFYNELTKRPDAVNQYLSYLKAHFNTRELEYLLEKLNRSDEIAMLKYRQSSSTADPISKISRLEHCLRTHFEQNPSLTHNASLIRQQISLLQRQRTIDVGDDMLQKQGKHIMFRALPRTRPIVNLPVITTLFYCCIYHYEVPGDDISSPLSIRKDHQLNEKQYTWTALRARAKMRKWTDIDGLFTTKGWLGGTKMKAVIGFDKVSGVLYRFGAPSVVLCKYLLLVDDLDRRLELAVKMHCHKAVIDTYGAQRDRRTLEQYHKKLKVHSEEWFYCDDMLKSNNIKWKS